MEYLFRGSVQKLFEAGKSIWKKCSAVDDKHRNTGSADLNQTEPVAVRVKPGGLRIYGKKRRFFYCMEVGGEIGRLGNNPEFNG